MRSVYRWRLARAFAKAGYPQIAIAALICTSGLLLVVEAEISRQESALATYQQTRATADIPAQGNDARTGRASLPPPGEWLAMLSHMHRLAQQRQMKVNAVEHQWQSEGQGTLRIESRWQWQGSWADATELLVAWLNEAPNLAVRKVSAVAGADGDTMAISVDTLAWFESPRAKVGP